jgi:cation transport regulator ChaC
MTKKSPDNKGGDIWIFAYGSLMWHPNFEYEEKCRAHLN